MTSPRVLFLGSLGHIPPTPDMRRQLDLMGGNAGNLVFQLATAQMIAAPLHQIGGGAPYALPKRRDLLVLPAANHLRPANWDPLSDFLEQADCPIAVFGLGADTQEGAALRGHASLMRLVGILRARAVLITYRGARSARIGAELGLQGVVLGCPSVFLNPAQRLGHVIAKGLARAAWHPMPRCAIHAGDPYNPRSALHRRAEQRLFSHVAQRGGLWLLASGGADACGAAAGQHPPAPALCAALGRQDAAQILMQSGHVPHDARTWIGWLRGCDLALGTRAHGTLAALAAGVPGILSPIDARTTELAQTMQLPQLPLDALATAASPQDCAAAAAFDPDAFDAWRITAARAMAAALIRIGLTPAPALQHLAAA
ncbi:polysaccharide pyruvyl transferase family protein [Ketogulonicigenium vulgare]|uniref:Putative membrane-anchored protein n=1 Tax=Ketogulonicigenium vulgare (strain WSH-001) TaxID=759362 RepID=F9Y4X3_KETVW|nr:polysaccharide pyruvyl transferase family protein [Ketogulonicigenium vulgare]AEM41857.1 putative membrane-anchored protein [Ketogulonicigenium vulgare WSH-001]AOZ55615.1 putative membrane-anchored protein [Ketogulonicigenium vulgare]